MSPVGCAPRRVDDEQQQQQRARECVHACCARGCRAPARRGSSERPGGQERLASEATISAHHRRSVVWMAWHGSRSPEPAVASHRSCLPCSAKCTRYGSRALDLGRRPNSPLCYCYTTIHVYPPAVSAPTLAPAAPAPAARPHGAPPAPARSRRTRHALYLWRFSHSFAVRVGNDLRAASSPVALHGR